MELRDNNRDFRDELRESRRQDLRQMAEAIYG